MVMGYVIFPWVHIPFCTKTILVLGLFVKAESLRLGALMPYENLKVNSLVHSSNEHTYIRLLMLILVISDNVNYPNLF